LKIEDHDPKRNTLGREYKILKALKGKGFPEAVNLIHDQERTILVMKLLGSSLDSCLRKCGGTFSLHTV